MFDMRRREFIATLGGAAAAWPLAARAQQPAMPVVRFLRSETLTDANVPYRVTAFRQGLKEAGFVEGQNVAIEYRVDEGQADRLPLLVADLLRRQVALIVGSGTLPALAAKAGTTTVPIVFVTGGDPVRDGLVASLSRPGGNVTGVSFFSRELAAKQLGLLRELRPGAPRIAVLADPKFPTTEQVVSEVRASASAIGQQIEVLYVSSDREIETAFTTLVQRGANALQLVGSARPTQGSVSREHQLSAVIHKEAGTPSTRPNDGHGRLNQRGAGRPTVAGHITTAVRLPRANTRSSAVRVVAHGRHQQSTGACAPVAGTPG
jgi:putative ABC transport system substrate-binding protein